MPQLALVADDLTGAADSSACFADHGLSTVIPLTGPSFPAADVIGLTTESRDIVASDAARAVGTAIAALVADQINAPRWVYKKIDSALRGHPREEIMAAMAAMGATRTLVAPALPSEGRTTVGGRQLVGGVPLEASHFAGPGVTSELLAIFANDRGLPVHRLDLPTIRNQPNEMASQFAGDAPGIVVADAETDDDLYALARAVGQSDLRLLCGTAGLARQLAAILPLRPCVPMPFAANYGGPILVVAGSKHATSARQITALDRSGAPIVRLDQAHIDDPSCLIDDVVAEVAAHLASGTTTVVTTAGLAPSAHGERGVANCLAAVTTDPDVQRHLGGLVLTGGDVAMAACTALGAKALWLGGEIYAGQPWGILAGGAFPGIPVATKAGSFGREDALIVCVDFLRNCRNTT
jgi:uncharacterized protein YgbK (DUF1537 family)